MVSVVVVVVVFISVSGNMVKAGPRAQESRSAGPLSSCQPRPFALSSPILSTPERFKYLFVGQDDLEHRSGNGHLQDHYGFKYYFNLNNDLYLS